jgi:hypothetical protein
MGFQNNGSLVCDTPGCKAMIDVPGPQVEVINKARAKGWHCFRGASFTGKALDSYICEQCMRSPRPKLDPVEVLRDQEPMF